MDSSRVRSSVTRLLRRLAFPLQNERGIVGTTAAILGGAAIGGGVAAYSSRQQSKAAKSAAEAQARYAEQALAPSKELEQMQVDFARDYYYPQARKEAGFYDQYRGPTLETENRLYEQQAGGLEALLPLVYGNLGLTQGEDGTYTSDPASVEQLYGLPEGYSDKIFQRNRRRVSEQYAPVRARQGERLAARGGLDSGAADQLFGEIDMAELQDVEDLAFDQSLAEFDMARQGRQQALQNVYGFYNLPGRLQRPSIAGAQENTGEVGSTIPYISDLYTPIPRVGVNYGDVAQGIYSGASAGAGLMPGRMPGQVGQRPGYGVPSWGAY